MGPLGGGLPPCGSLTQMATHTADEVDADLSLHEAPLPIMALETVVVSTAGDELAGLVGDTWNAPGDVAYESEHPERLVKDAGPNLSDTAGNTVKENATAAYTAVNCADARWPTEWDRWERDAGRLHVGAPPEPRTAYRPAA